MIFPLLDCLLGLRSYTILDSTTTANSALYAKVNKCKFIFLRTSFQFMYLMYFTGSTAYNNINRYISSKTRTVVQFHVQYAKQLGRTFRQNHSCQDHIKYARVGTFIYVWPTEATQML